MKPLYNVYVSDRGPASATEIAAIIAETLADLGYCTAFPALGLPERGRNRINLVVAPNDFFRSQGGHSQRDLLDAARASITLGVDGPGTPSFDVGTNYASVGPMALDISEDGVDALRCRGIEASHLQLGYHRRWDRWGGDPNRPRPTDLLFFGSMTPHRDYALSVAAPLLWDCNAEILLSEFSRPTSGARAPSVGDGTLASSRVLLNIHTDEVPHLEWPLVLAAIMNGCLVVTETSADYAPLLPGEHLIAAPSDFLGAYAASLVADEALRAEVAATAYDFVRTKLEFKTLLEPVCALVEDAVASTTRFRRPLLIDAPASPPVPPRPAQLDALLETERHMFARVNELHNGETDLFHQVERLQAHLLHGSADHVETSVTEAWKGASSQVSAVIVSHNNSASITEAMSSVMSSLGTAVELVVVDDHSEDGSVDAIRQLMASTHWFATKLVARAASAGVGTARNIGMTEARSNRVFLSDAETMIFPKTLAKLSATLDESPDSAAAYGIIAGIGGSGLSSYLPFEAARLTERDYLAGVAMIRRRVWKDIGGYDTQVSHRGYHDYEFWLRLANEGHDAEFVPEFVGRRLAGSGPRREVDVETAPLMNELRELYPLLPWGQS